MFLNIIITVFALSIVLLFIGIGLSNSKVIGVAFVILMITIGLIIPAQVPEIFERYVGIILFGLLELIVIGGVVFAIYTIVDDYKDKYKEKIDAKK